MIASARVSRPWLLSACTLLLWCSSALATITDVLDPGAAARERAERQRAVRDSLAMLAHAPTADDIADVAIDPRSYVVGPGDKLSITTWGVVNSTRLVVVSPEGEVVVPGSGSVRVGHLTLDAARARIESAMRAQLRDTRVSVRLEGVRRFKVYVTGSVRTPGVVRATATMRASEVIERAGGLTDEAAHRGLRLTHADGARELVDLAGFTQGGRLEGNPYVQEGDLLFVPARAATIDVQGAVGTIGVQDFQPGDVLGTALAVAGGPLDGAILDRIEYFRIDASGAQTGPFYVDATTPEGRALPLHAGDHIFVRRVADWNRVRLVFVTGQVRFPGQYAIDDVATIADVVARAGGFLSDADSSAVTIDRSWPKSPTEAELRAFDAIDPAKIRNDEAEILRQVGAGRPGLISLDWVARPSDRATPVRDGDEIRIPRAILQVRVAGEVRRPGLIPYRPGLSLTEYVRAAGGYTSRADTKHVRVGKMREWHTVSAKDAAPIQQGDVVWVVQKAPGTGWARLRDTIAIAAQLVTLYLVIQNNSGK